MKSLQLEDDLKSIYSDYIERYFPNSKSPTITPDDFEILSTIRYDPSLSKHPPTTYHEISPLNVFLLPEHVARLRYTFQFFHYLYGTPFDSEITEDFLLKQIKESLEQMGKPLDKPYKIRGLFKLGGTARLEIHETTNRENLLLGLQEISHQDGSTTSSMDEAEQKWDVYVNTRSSLISPFTSFKTTKRDVYNEARKILPGLRPGNEEVLLFNSQGQLMEGSITNVAIKRKRDGKWVTPLLSSGCLCGVMRHFLLRRNYIEEDIVLIKDVSIGDEMILFNGVMGVVRGRVVG